MPSPETLLPFLAATLAFALTPGPGAVVLAAVGLAEGPRAAARAALVFHLAGYAHVAAAASGAALLLAAAPGLFPALKFLGAGWLVCCGLRMIARRPGGAGRPPGGRDAALIGLADPQSTLFYLAFLPPFAVTGADAPAWLQMAVLGTVANALFSATDAVWIALARGMAARAPGAARRAMPVAGGVLLAALGLAMALRA